jgi:uncharacterized membrane protein
MDLEEMKSTWTQMSTEMEKQKKLTNEIIIKMANQKSKNSLENIKRLELLGGLVMGAALNIGLAIVLFNGMIQSIPLLCFAFVSMFIFSYSMYMSWTFIQVMNKIDLQENTLEDSHRYFSEFKAHCKRHKKRGMILNIPTVIFSLPVVMKIFGGVDIFTQFNEAKSFLSQIFIAGVLVSIPIILLIIRFYKKNVKAATEAHQDAESIE